MAADRRPPPRRYGASRAAPFVLALALSGCGDPIVQPSPAVVAAAPEGALAARFPLKRLAGARCLVDQSGEPFLLQGDTPWSLIVQLKRADVDRYLSDRRQRGFNTLLVNLIEHQYADRPPYNAYGDAPFLAPGDYARPNEKYFAHVDWVLKRAAEEGFVVLLTPSYLGFQGGGEGWFEEMRAAGPVRLRAYGRYLGERYRHMPNVIWMEGGDYAPTDHSLVEAIVAGLRETAPAALHSYHAGRGTAARQYLGAADWLGLNTIYTNKDGVVAAALGEYAASTLPFILTEALYEGEGASEAIVRAQAYQAMLSGACGQQMGNKPLWPFGPGQWQAALDTPGARSMSRLRVLLEELRWWELRPAAPGFVGGDLGTGVERVAAAISEDGRRAVVYLPSAREVTLESGSLKGARLALRWIDPADGQGRPADVGPGQPVRLTSPGRNSSGYSDWLLIAEVAP